MKRDEFKKMVGQEPEDVLGTPEEYGVEGATCEACDGEGYIEEDREDGSMVLVKCEECQDLDDADDEYEPEDEDEA